MHCGLPPLVHRFTHRLFEPPRPGVVSRPAEGRVSTGLRAPRQSAAPRGQPKSAGPADIRLAAWHARPDNERVDLAGKLQIKPGTKVAAIGAPADGPDLAGLWEPAADPASAGAVIGFTRTRADLEEVTAVFDSARHDRLTWIAYPKAGAAGHRPEPR
jgi:hypothetical protein